MEKDIGKTKAKNYKDQITEMKDELEKLKEFKFA